MSSFENLRMVRRVVLALLLVFVGSTRADDTAAGVGVVQRGRLSSATLLGIERTGVDGSPDGLTFHFLVVRSAAASGKLTLKETRDLLVEGASYRQITRVKLEKVFEPQTIVDDVSDFLAQHPDLRAVMPQDAGDALVLSVAIGGAPLTAEDRVDVVLTVGFGGQVEPLRFNVAIPAAKRP